MKNILTEQLNDSQRMLLNDLRRVQLNDLLRVQLKNFCTFKYM